MHVPLAAFPVNPKDSLISFNQRKIEGAGYFAQKGLDENILADIKAQGNRPVSPFDLLQSLQEP